MSGRRRAPIAGRYTAEEVALATRNRGMPLEALRYDVTPPGLHYLLVHFDIPDAADVGALALAGLFERGGVLTMPQLLAMPQKTVRVTLECAGNGRGQLAPRYPSVPWLEEGVSTAEWTGVPLRFVLERAGLRTSARELVFHGADRGFDAGVEHHFARSLVLAEAMRDDVLVAHAMNGAPLAPQHGAPLRLVVPGWYGMASVKWLRAIEAIDRAFDGVQQARSYHFRRDPGEQGEPCTRMRVNSLMVPPGIPDFYSRKRSVAAGTTTIRGRAWSGAAPIVRVELGVDGAWEQATIEPSTHPHAWTGWRATWHATPGEHVLSCRAADALGNVQPLAAPWDLSGFGNNGVQRIIVSVNAAAKKEAK